MAPDKRYIFKQIYGFDPNIYCFRGKYGNSFGIRGIARGFQERKVHINSVDRLLFEQVSIDLHWISKWNILQIRHRPLIIIFCPVTVQYKHFAIGKTRILCITGNRNCFISEECVKFHILLFDYIYFVPWLETFELESRAI